MTILITGASGFIGSFIVEEALKRGLDTWAAVRNTSSKKYLQDNRIHFVELDFSSIEHLKNSLRELHFDYIVHAAGVTKCQKKEDFFHTNVEGTQHFVEALLALNIKIKKFVFLSSLSVYGAVREEVPHTEIKGTDTPQPNTCYGQSKLLAEQYLLGLADRLNITILRPTGVYGPRETDYFLMVKSIANHVDFAVGRRQQDITFVYVSDVVQAVFLAMEQQESGKAYFVTDGERYDSREFSRLISVALGGKRSCKVVLPIFLARQVCRVADLWGRLTGSVTALNNDKFYILAQRNWLCDVTTTMRELGYKPQVKLAEGVSRAVEWYKSEGWL